MPTFSSLGENMLTASLKTKLNNGESEGFIQKLGSAIDAHVSCLKVSFDYAEQGGAVGDITLKDPDGNPAVLPSGAIVTRVFANITTTLTSGGLATIALKSEAAGDLKGATAVASWSAGFLEGIQDGAAANFVKTTADRTVKATVAVAALTAGKFDVYIYYVK